MAHIITNQDPTGKTEAEIASITIATPTSYSEAGATLAACDHPAWWIDTADGSISGNVHASRARAVRAKRAIEVAPRKSPAKRPRAQRKYLDGRCMCKMCLSGNEGLCPYGNG